MTDEESKQRRREAREKWIRNNPEKNKLSKQKWANNHPDYNKEYSKEYYKKNIDIKREYREKHYQENKERVSIQSHQRREQKLNHCVYCLEVNGLMYIGSTIEIGARLALHKRDISKRPEQKVYKVIRESGGWDAVKVHILMKDIPFEDLRIRLEQHYLDMVPVKMRLNSKSVIAIKGE